MKSALLLHGIGGSSKDYFWFADTKQFLELKGFKVWWPLLPNANKPQLAETLSFVLQNMPEVNAETIIIGHSSACPLILSLLETIGTKINQVILVSGFYQSIDDPKDGGMSDLMLPKNSFDYEKIKSKTWEIILINSNNDPWGCDDKQARPVAEKLGAKFILAKDQGHMGSIGFNQPYRELKLLKDELGQ